MSAPAPDIAAPVRYCSTRARGATVSFGEALMQGLAPDGGLYVPTRWPNLDPRTFPHHSALPQIATTLLAPFVAGDPLAGALAAISAEAFNFPAPLVPLDGRGVLSVLELFHGPTAAFKDFGARFLAASFQHLRPPGSRALTILVATSGDTGAAVAAAFHRRPGIEIAVLFPAGLVSPIQQMQLTCWGENVRSFAVRGSFDDCQRLVKQAFADAALRQVMPLSSANSINLGRLLPQAVYYAAASLAIWRASGERACFVIPSGNLGNAVACIWARQLGLPIDAIVLAHNANRTVPDFLESGDWRPRPSVATLASAMDVGDPSNMERLRWLFPQWDQVRGAVSAATVEDERIRARIRQGFDRFGQIWCPHTATAAEVYEELIAPRLARSRARGRSGAHWVIVATAHPAKFAAIVEPLIGRDVPVPQSLQKLLARPTHYESIGPHLADLKGALGAKES
ncbi:MAG TPA: threonine synthase [Steroidobacteraceae bacterium]